jgi:DNA-binding transcriptional MocR family regulator
MQESASANQGDLYHFDRTLAVPVYVQLADGIERAIRSGLVPPGAKLPSARTLAREQGTTPVTVNQAFRRLRSRGLVVSRGGSGTYVSGSVSAPAAPAAPGSFLHLDRREPPASLFPADVVRQIMDRILDEEGGEAFAYGEEGGDRALKDVLTAELVDAGFGTSERDVVVFSGAQQALSLLLRAWLQRGDWVLVERPTYPGMLRLLQEAGARVEAVDIGPAGPDPARVAHLLSVRPIRLFYAMPVYHNPTGICWSAECKRRVAELCAERGVLLVEDDALSGVDFGQGRPRALAACVPACRGIFYIRSFSMILMPGFRLGFCLAPRDLANTLKRAKEQSDLLTSGFFQRVLCRFISEGHMRRHLSLIEPYYRGLFARATAAAAEQLGEAGFRLTRGSGGPSLWARLPDGVAGGLFQRHCIREGVGVVPGEHYSTDQSTADGVGLAFSRLGHGEWVEGLHRVARAALASREETIADRGEKR